MKLSGAALGNAIGWGVFLLLFAAAVIVVDALGFLGLALLGGAVWLVCSRAALDEDAAGWGTEVFRARMAAPRRPEDRAAQAAGQATWAGSVRFYGRCAMVVTGIGIAGVVWEVWNG